MRQSFLPIPSGCHFTLQCLPYGVFSDIRISRYRCGVAIGDFVVDLYACHEYGLFSSCKFDSSVFLDDKLNSFMALSRQEWDMCRERLTDVLSSDGDSVLRENADLSSRLLVPMSAVTMHLPAAIGDYTDFYSSRDHATNVGIMFRGVANALQPNWLHLPVGYHGRSSSIVTNGCDIPRPRGQLQIDPDDADKGSIYGACKLMDFELEIGMFVGGKSSRLGRPIQMNEVDEFIFGLVLLNDWSARDVQKYEYIPLGPFTAKNFATTISPWVVPMSALAKYKCPSSSGPQDPPVLPYLSCLNDSFDIKLQVILKTATCETIISTSNMMHLYWNMQQQLVHHTVTGCNVNAGDLLGSGTISGPTVDSLGSMLELSWKGTRDVVLSDGSSRKFLKDGDVVIMRGFCSSPSSSEVELGFGDCAGRIIPAGSFDQLSPFADSSSSSSSSCHHEIKLYGYWRSSCTWRVRLALALKGISFEYIPVHLTRDGGQQYQDDYMSKNSMSQVPTMTYKDDDGRECVLTQSLAIIDWLEESYPNSIKLIPSSNHHHHHHNVVKQVAEIINSGIQPLQNLSLLNTLKAAGVDSTAFARAAIEKGLTQVEALISGCSGSYCYGERVSLADVCLVPQMYNARRFAADLTKFPTCVRIDEYLSRHPAFIQAHPSNQIDADK